VIFVSQKVQFVPFLSISFKWNTFLDTRKLYSIPEKLAKDLNGTHFWIPESYIVFQKKKLAKDLVPFRGLELSDNCFSCWLPN
jgi:hypothetical protein